MAAQIGSAMLLKRGNADGPPETFTDAAGLRTKTMNLNRESVDITNSDSVAKWRELLPGGGIRSLSVSGSGVFKDAAIDESVRTDFYAETIGNWQVLVPDFGTFEGAMQITSIEYAGEHNGEITHTISLESAGVITFTAV
jgi:TP901-1 family phage major tail protein